MCIGDIALTELRIITSILPRRGQEPAACTSRSIISPAPLHLLPGLRVRSSYQVVSLGSYLDLSVKGRSHLGAGFALRCFQRFSFLDVATQLWPGQAN